MFLARQTANRLGISVRTVYRWEAAGRLRPMMRLDSGQRRFSAKQVDGLLRGRCGGHSGAPAVDTANGWTRGLIRAIEKCNQGASQTG